MINNKSFGFIFIGAVIGYYSFGLDGAFMGGLIGLAISFLK
jgi:hypothetical protein